MHPAWYIDDIRHLIFEHLKRGDLARLARTCSALFHLATDELWKSINTTAIFLHTLPEDGTRRELQREDLQRLEFYSSKVQNLLSESNNIHQVIQLPQKYRKRPKRKETNTGPAEKSWVGIWEEIANLRPTSEFLINLRRLRLSGVAEDLLVPLIGITGANLIHLYIKYVQHRRPGDLVFKFLDGLQDTPKLEYLFVRDGEPDVLPIKLIQQAPLRHLRLDPRIYAHRHEDYQFKKFHVRPEVLDKSTLEHLTIGLTREWYGPEMKSLDGKYLPALKTLWLNLTTFWPVECNDECAKPNPGSWTCKSSSSTAHSKRTSKSCERQPPTAFLDKLDNPELSLLNIKFPLHTTGPMFVDVVSAAVKNCRLQNLTELALAGGGFINNCGECGRRPPPAILPTHLREAVINLPPMSRLKILRISVAPNFLNILDLELYRSITKKFPALEKLWLGHSEFAASSEIEGVICYEKVSLKNLAAFCSMLPCLVDVSIGTADAAALEEEPYAGWECPSIQSLSACGWTGRRNAPLDWHDRVHRSLKTYFPNSKARREFHPRRYWLLA